MAIDKSSIKLYDCKDSKYIQIKQMSYIEDGIRKTWDVVNSYDSASILIHNIDNDSVIIVKQFRPAVFLRNNNGYMYELCAGLIDKENKTIDEIIKEEALEECGYQVESVTKIAEFYSSVGTSGSKQSVFYTEVNNNQKIANGGGIDNECIEVVEIKVNEIQDFLKLNNITPSLGFSFMWFLSNKKAN